MTPPLRLLLVEDSAADAELILRELRGLGRPLEHVRVDSEPELRRALAGGRWDAILSDWTLPRFSGLAALQLTHALQVDTPFIIVTGTLGEERAVEATRSGALDYVLKSQLKRLPKCVERALQEQDSLRAKRKAERLLGYILESISDGIVVADGGGKFLLVNAAAERDLGLKAVEVSPARWPEVFGIFRADTSTPFPADELALVRAMRGERTGAIGEFIRNPQVPEGVHLSVVGSPLRDERGAVEGGVAVFRRRSEDKLRALLEATPDAMVIVNQYGKIVLVNAQTERLFGYPRGELVGQPAQMLGAGGLFADPSPAGATREGVGRRKDGTEFPIELSLSPLETDEGTLISSTIRDVTERKRVERAILEANRAKSEFLAHMSHELRTPLNVIIGFAEIMHRGRVGPLAEQHREYLGDILTSAKHLLQLTNDVLDLAKVESGKLTLRPEPVDLVRLAREVRDIVRGLAGERGIRIEMEDAGEGGRPVVAVADPARVKQVLYNLLSNAIKFSPEGGRVAVRLRGEAEASVRLEVQDQGPGIAPEDMPKLFVEFQQLENGAARPGSGTGLGLALTKRIVEAHGGTVGVESARGRGSTFFATFPRGGGQER